MNKLFYKLAVLLIVPLGITLLQDCYPNDSLSATETDVVLTVYNDSVDFTTLSTYYMNDTVYILDDEDEKTPIDNPDAILNALASNMAAAGYTRIGIESEDKPDVVLLTGAFTSTTVSVGWWYPYYGWGGGWWYWSANESADRGTNYWGGYYPPYWGGVPYYTSYTTGTVVFDMVNPDDYTVIGEDTLTTVYWNGGIQGVLNGGNTDTRVKNSIDQAFIQSPQIKTGN